MLAHSERCHCLRARLGGSGYLPNTIREAVPRLLLADKAIPEAMKVLLEAILIPVPQVDCLVILLLFNKANGALVLQSQIVMSTTSKKQSEYYSNIYLSTKLTFQGLCP